MQVIWVFMVRVKRDSLNEYWATVEILDRFVDLGKRKGYQDMRNIFVCFTSPAPKGGTYARKYMNYTELQAEIVNRGNKTLDEVSRSVDVDKSIDELSE